LIVHALFERFDSFGPISEWLAPLPGKEWLWIVASWQGIDFSGCGKSFGNESERRNARQARSATFL
jgi:hypothetical protein